MLCYTKLVHLDNINLLIVPCSMIVEMLGVEVGGREGVGAPLH